MILEAGAAGHHCVLPREISNDPNGGANAPTALVDLCGGNDRRSMSFEKSDHLIVVMKPGNAGGAKEMTS